MKQREEKDTAKTGRGGDGTEVATPPCLFIDYERKEGGVLWLSVDRSLEKVVMLNIYSEKRSIKVCLDDYKGVILWKRQKEFMLYI